MILNRRAAALGLMILLGGLSCNDDNPPSTDGGVNPADSTSADLPPPLPPAPFPTPVLVITSPTGRDSVTTDQQQITFGGIAAGEITALKYTLTSDSGTPRSNAIELAEQWQFAEQLSPGDNRVEVVATSAEANEERDSIVVTLNPGFPMGPASADPEAVLQGAATPILFTIKLADTTHLVANTVKVVAVDLAGQPTGATLTDLTDDGQGGDATAGDGIYSALTTVDDSADQVIPLRIAADTSGPGAPRTAYSQLFTVAVISPLTEAEATALETSSALAAQRFDEHSRTMDQAAAAARVVEDLKALAEVTDAGLSPDGFSIWWEMTSGAPVAFSFYPEGTRGSCSEPPPPVPPNPRSTALLLEPFQLEFGASAITGLVDTSLQGAICPSYDPIEKRPNAQATVDELRKMDDYGVVQLSTHGGVWNNQVTLMSQDKILKTHVTAPDSPYMADFRATPRRLIWYNHKVAGTVAKYWAITPAFVTRYNSGFEDNSIVHADACSSAANSTMAAAFLAGGAALYSGYTDTVSTAYSFQIVGAYFQALVDGKSVKEAWEHARRQAGNVDPTRASTKFVYTPSSAGKISLISPCTGYTRIVDHRDHVFGGSANSKEVSDTVYFSSDKVIKSPFDPRGRTFILQSMRRTCRYNFEKSSTLPGGGLTRTNVGMGEQAETYLAAPDSPFEIDPDMRYGVVKLELDPEAGSVRIYPTPKGACANRDDWVFDVQTSYAWTPPDVIQEMGGCQFWGGITDVPGFNNASDYIEVTAPQVEITDAFIKGSVPISNDKGTATLEFYYELKPRE